MMFPEFDLETADGGRLANESLAGRPWYAYMARHPGCYVCQFKLQAALAHRDRLRAQGGDIVVFFTAPVEYTRHWVSRFKAEGDLPADLTFVIDPEATVYEQLGTVRTTFLGEAAHVLPALWESRSQIRKWRWTPKTDVLRMGADVAVGADGEILLKHVCRHAEDRADPARVIDALLSPIPV